MADAVTPEDALTFTRLARGFKERAAALGLKGKRRDEALMDYASGYGQALDALGQTDTANRWLWLLSIRGYDEVERHLEGLAAKDEEQA